MGVTKNDKSSFPFGLKFPISQENLITENSNAQEPQYLPISNSPSPRSQGLAGYRG